MSTQQSFQQLAAAMLLGVMVISGCGQNSPATLNLSASASHLNKDYEHVLTQRSLLSSTSQQPATGRYEYPIKPGDSKWRTFDSHLQMLDATQIPTSTLQAMSTETLVQACIDYPLYLEIWAHNNEQLGFDHLLANFNGMRELFERSDSGRILLKRYEKMDPTEVERIQDPSVRGGFALHFAYLELILAQKSTLEKLSTSEREELARTAINFAHAKAHYAQENYGLRGQRVTVYLLMRALRIDHPDALAAIAVPMVAPEFDQPNKLLNKPEIDLILQTAGAALPPSSTER